MEKSISPGCPINYVAGEDRSLSMYFRVLNHDPRASIPRDFEESLRFETRWNNVLMRY